MATSPRILVTGGGLGIGCATVQILLSQYNARVIAFTLEYGEELGKLQKVYSTQKKLWVCVGDVTKEEDTEAAIAIATNELGGLDALVISAGIESRLNRIVDMPYAEFVRTMNINVCGAFLSVQKSLPLLRVPSISRPTGVPARVVILSSTADGGKYAGRSAYSSSKSALTRFIATLANEERDSGVDVYGVYPGLTRTGLAQGLIDRKFDDVLFPEEAAKYKDWISRGAVEGPEWCAEAVARLCTGLSEGLKGQTAFYSAHVPELKLGFW